MSKKDYYDVLGVGKQASADELKQAYRKMAKKYHPDVNKEVDAETKFKEAKEAFDVLSDDQKRAQYDRFGHADPMAGMGGGGAGGFNPQDFGGGFGDIFDMFFGGGGGGRRNPNGPQRGADLQYTMTIDFKEAVFGKETEVQIPRTENCETCHGSGAKAGTKADTCGVCNGSGQQEVIQNTAFGRIVNRRVCQNCSGQGKVIKQKCVDCHGGGKVKKTRKIQVKIPAGVDDGAQLRVSGEGEQGTRGGTPGDLYIVLRVKQHEFFQRDGDDIYCEIPLTFTQAALGDEIEVPTLTGKVKLRVPEATQTNTMFRIKGKGVPRLRSYGSGDQHVRVVIVTPTKISNKERELLEQLAAVRGETTQEASAQTSEAPGQENDENTSLFEKFKRMFVGE